IEHNLDIVFISGDITHQGKGYNDNVYQFLEEILDEIKVTKENVYIVPGNHDIKRSKLMERLINDILGSKNAKDEMNALDEETYEVLLAGQEEYYKFYEKFLERPHPKGNPHFVVEAENYNIIHINTSLISGIANAEGNILVGLGNLHKALREITEQNEKVNFAIGHHTINCINSFEKQSLLHRFSDHKIDFYLNGHVHQASYHHEVNNYNSTFMFTAGANMIDDYAQATFLSGTVDTENGNGKVTYHSWSKDHEYWYINNTIGRETVDGCYYCNLERFKKKKSEAKSVIDNELKIDVKVDENDFRNFLIDFYEVIQSEKEVTENLIPKDVENKFINMICSPTLSLQYDQCSTLFPIVNMILNSSAYVGIEKKLLIPNLIMSEYMEVLYDFPNGDLIFRAIRNTLVNRYKDQVHYNEDRVKFYITVLIFWSIYECNIFNDDKRIKGVTV
ncbi:metallophosphoesterase, partial [Priestia megaterium]|uniref:metallophosphoesterase family protein n=1 Tax=Priestia megaterium TaxID=1404 RepID=UPI002E1F71ED|nr:metallophosphoesterase [Priestia megaterium]